MTAASLASRAPYRPRHQPTMAERRPPGDRNGVGSGAGRWPPAGTTGRFAGGRRRPPPSWPGAGPWDVTPPGRGRSPPWASSSAGCDIGVNATLSVCPHSRRVRPDATARELRPAPRGDRIVRRATRAPWTRLNEGRRSVARTQTPGYSHGRGWARDAFEPRSAEGARAGSLPSLASTVETALPVAGSGHRGLPYAAKQTLDVAYEPQTQR